MVFNWLLLLVPPALVLRYLFHAGPLWPFVCAVVSVVLGTSFFLVAE